MATPILSGIYAIRNTINGKVYIGSSVNVSDRISQHRCLLKKKKHHNRILQNSWAKHGESAFCFEVVEIVPDKNGLIKEEQKWIDSLRCVHPLGYNIKPQAHTSLGIKHSPEVVEANRMRGLGRKQSPETIEKQRLAKIGKTKSPETRANMSRAQRGRVAGPQSEERRKLTSKVMKIVAATNEWRSHLAKSNGWLSDEQVREIRRTSLTGTKAKDIAKSFGIRSDTVYKILRMISYTHVE